MELHRKAPRRALISLIVLVGAAGAAQLPAAAAAVITPTTTADGFGDGPPCTLREAVRAANTNVPVDYCSSGAPGEDTISLGAGTYALTIPGNDSDTLVGDLDVSEDLVIQGAGMSATTIDAVTLGDRIIDAYNTANVVLRDLTLANADASGPGGAINGTTGGSLTLERVTVRDSHASLRGGGIYVSGSASLTLRSSVISSNESSGDGAGVYHGSSGALLIEDSAIVDNGRTGDGSPGGGLVSYSANAQIQRSLIAGNTSPASGAGGVMNNSSSSMTITNSTISGNSSSGSAAGGIRNDGALSLQHVTVAQNVANYADGILNYGSMTMSSSVLQNPDNDCANDASGNFTSLGDNVVSTTAGSCTFGGSGDRTNVTPGLGSLADNGGPTATHALLPGSPAIDLASGGCTSTDQRGAPRPSSGCDAGAYEVVTCLGVLVNRVGTNGDDTLGGTAGADGVLAMGGNDVVSTAGGNDVVCAGAGNDTVRGGGGKDVLLGEGGNDRLLGEGGNDRLLGQGGSDILKGGPGKDRLKGGGGKDRLNGGPGRDRCGKEKKEPKSCER